LAPLGHAREIDPLSRVFGEKPQTNHVTTIEA
jgi:hypothetical protein